jgi:hypothetical protein
MSPHEDVGLFRVAGAFPAFSKDGSKLAFVDNEFKSVWLADSDGMRVVFEVIHHSWSVLLWFVKIDDIFSAVNR